MLNFYLLCAYTLAMFTFIHEIILLRYSVTIHYITHIHTHTHTHTPPRTRAHLHSAIFQYIRRDTIFLLELTKK